MKKCLEMLDDLSDTKMEEYGVYESGGFVLFVVLILNFIRASLLHWAASKNAKVLEKIIEKKIVVVVVKTSFGINLVTRM